MEATGGMVAGSHKRNELVRIRHDSSETGPKPLKNLNGQICQICGDSVGLTADGDVFVACNECAFPVCRPCYEYERKDGNQACPQCKTRYKRHRGSPRVDGDEDEDDVDDLENEFNHGQGNSSKARTQWDEDADLSLSSRHDPRQPIPLLTNGQPMSGEIQTPDTQSVRTTSGPLGPSEKLHSLPYIDPRQPVPVRIVDPSKDLNSYGLGNVDWKERVEGWKLKQEKNVVQMTGRYNEGKGGDIEGTGSNGEELQMVDDARQPLSRVVPLPSSQITPYRVVIILRLIILCFFLQYRVTHPVKDAYPLWLTSVICEIWFAVSWLLDQFPKWHPINRETYLDRLALRYDREGELSQLAPVDVFVSTVDPLKEPPLVTANTVLSILSVDYPVDKVSCYVSDDGSAMLTFESLSETAEFAKKWVPFCKKHNIEPRAPEFYFAQKIDYLKDKIQPSFVKERRTMKREYEEFKVRINALVAKAQKMPEEGWTMQDGTAWPGNNPRDHPGMIQVFLGHSGGLDTDGNELPRLVYVSREKRPGFQHHKKAGAMNALIRVSAVLTNGAYLLNVDCDHYFNNSKALKEAMCFMMDPAYGKKTCYVQFPQRFDGIDLHDRYANRNIVFFDINLKGLDGIQGPVYVGTGCCFNRKALYGYDPVLTEEDLEPNIIVKSCCGSTRKKGRGGKKNTDKRGLKRTESTTPIFNMEDIEEGVEGYDDERLLLMSQKSLEKRFGQSPVFVAATFMEQGGIPPSTNPATLLKEAIHVISCGYEDKTEWGKEIGWIYGSVTEDILTGFKMHARGWISVYCMPPRPAFKGSAPINLSDRLNQINLKGLDGIQGPVYVGTGCCFNRKALYGYDPVLTEEDLEPNIIVKSCCGSTRKKGRGGKKNTDKRGLKRTESTTPIFNMEDIEEGVEGYDDERLLLMSQKSLEKRFGQSPVFVAATFMEQGGIPPSTNPATLLKEAIHVISCGYEDKTEWGKEIGWIYGSVTEDILTGFKMHARGWISVYCMPPRPAFKGSAPINLSDRLNQISNIASMWFILLFVSIFTTSILELRWSGVSIEDWWRNEQFWVIGGTSAHLFAVFQGLLKVLAGIDTNFTVTSKASDEDGDFAELYVFKWTTLLIPPTTVLFVNLIGIVAGVSIAINSGYQSWGPLFGKLFFAIWVIAHLYPFLKGLLGRQNRTPTIIIVWSFLLASIFSLLWVRIDPFTKDNNKASGGQCGINC
ncbi:hypothetical protein TanjilG_07884 [Lupinus angustifolius]|uniref:Cellulose synthase n=1 Tax=Lupinus angustifolius TaxID=3871 RepID=A0A1J7H428_LUPAN|nr:hypothetical protein TanjilG_07884 [Lupinus angustifolius]